jgi:hemolysin activation/secretion protein
MSKIHKSYFSLLSLLGGLLLANASFGQAPAQLPTDSGRILQETAPRLEEPPKSEGLKIQIPELQTNGKKNGTSVPLKDVELIGNKALSTEVLRGVVGGLEGKTFDLDGMRALAKSVSDFYRANGFPFVRAVLPAQDLTSGILKIQIIEGRYGKVEAIGDPELASKAQQFLDDLKPGETIATGPLERAALILGDLPGIKVGPVIRPGSELGAGDLSVQVDRAAAYGGQVSLDNYGNRYTGTERLSASVFANSPFTFGDRLALRAIYTGDLLWLGALTYEIPLGGSGIRANFGYEKTSYEIGEEFKVLDASGSAEVKSVGLSYPFIRSLGFNLYGSVAFQRKDMEDRYDAVSYRVNKSSESVPISLQFNNRDAWAGGGLTFGALTLSFGDLNLDETARSTDIAGTEGHFRKVSLELARIQRIDKSLTLYARFSGQWASENLDGSEGFLLGGPNGVRAYPVGEGAGDQGWLGQLEIRYSVGSFTPFVFYDHGQSDLRAKSYDAGSDLSRRVSGGGVGLRYSYLGWTADASVAWRNAGGEPISDNKDKDPRFWVNVGYRF